MSTREGPFDMEDDEEVPESGPRPRASEVARALDLLPDVRDGLNRLDRVILWQLGVLGRERGGRMVPTAMLYGRVVEHVDVDVPTFQRALARLVGKGVPKP